MIRDVRTNNIILIGMPGSGKTTIGKLLASMLDYKFIDSDQLIFEKTGKTPRQVVEENGREFFLSIQDEVIIEIKQNDCVLATGGGLVHSDLAMKYLKSIGIVIYLNTEYDVIEERMDASRKLVRANGTLLDLYNERSPLYNRYADTVLDCDSNDPQLLCNKILKVINII
ncbi:MAG TPA: shikimate kinase [Ruminiclostridium sp.]